MTQFKGTPGPWEYVPSTEHHGPYVTTGGEGFGDIADCYAMSDPSSWSVRNGGTSRPINHQGELADANARLIASAPALLEALIFVMDNGFIEESENIANAAIRQATGEEA